MQGQAFERIMKRLIEILIWGALIPLCCAQVTDRVIVKSVHYSAGHVTIDVGPAVPQYGGPDIAGMHGETMGCNTKDATCYSPAVGEDGVLVDGPTVYEGPNVTIRWGGVRGTYALYEQY